MKSRRTKTPKAFLKNIRQTFFDREYDRLLSSPSQKTPSDKVVRAPTDVKHRNRNKTQVRDAAHERSMRCEPCCSIGVLPHALGSGVPQKIERKVKEQEDVTAVNRNIVGY